MLKTTEYENGVLICTKHRTPISKRNGKFFCVKCRRNLATRAKNQILRDICGTSAAAARRDMGI